MELFKMTCHEVRVLKDDTLERLISFNRELKVGYSTIKDQCKKAKLAQEEKTRVLAQELRNCGGDFRRLDSRIDAVMESHIEQLRQADRAFQVLQDQMPKLPERPPVNNTEIVRISKAMLKEVKVVANKEEVPGVEMIRRMKKEKAAKILRAYRAHKLIAYLYIGDFRCKNHRQENCSKEDNQMVQRTQTKEGIYHYLEAYQMLSRIQKGRIIETFNQEHLES